MTLQIHDPRAHELAEKLARLRDVSLDDAVIEALERRLSEEQTDDKGASVMEAARQARERLQALSKGPGREMTKDEIDDMWGQ